MGQCHSTQPRLPRDPSLRVCSQKSTSFRNDTSAALSRSAVSHHNTKEDLTRHESTNSIQQNSTAPHEISSCSASSCSPCSCLVLGDRYKISLTEVIGEGEFGTVYACSDLEHRGQPYSCCEVVNLIPLNSGKPSSPRRKSASCSPKTDKPRLLAAKVIKKQNLTEQCFEKLNREIRIGLMCRHHQHLCHTLDVLETEEDIIIIMPRVLQGNLIEYVHDRRLETHSDTLSEHDAKHIALQLLDAVSELHKMGVAHRDIKLDNILVDSSSVVTLTDFGCAVVAPALPPTPFVLSDAADAAGTRAYSSPEMRHASTYDAYAADIWSLGVVLHVLLSGFFPFPEKLPSQQMPTWYRPPPLLSKDCEDVLKSILGTVDEQRRPSADALQKAAWFSS